MNIIQTDTSSPAPPSNQVGLPVLVRRWAEMIKIEHTVFALPFALSGLILGTAGLPGIATTMWTILSFAGARSAAMTLNRLIDAQIDARNPRTKSRAIPQAEISRVQALVFAFLCFGLMLWSASHLPPICLWLSPIAIVWLSFYSYTKRFTWMCHICLGIALAGACLGGWVACGGLLSNPAAWILAMAVCTWVAGFDIIYACQDIDIDKAEHLHSMPARFGLSRSLAISSGLHVATIICLTLLGFVLHLGPIYWLGVAGAAGMLSWEHSLVKPHDLSRVDAAFFTINGWVSIGTFIAILGDKLMSLSGQVF